MSTDSTFTLSAALSQSMVKYLVKKGHPQSASRVKHRFGRTDEEVTVNLEEGDTAEFARTLVEALESEATPEHASEKRKALRVLNGFIIAFKSGGQGRALSIRGIAEGVRAYLASNENKWLVSTRAQDSSVMYLPMGVSVVTHEGYSRRASVHSVELNLVFNTHSGFRKTSVTLASGVDSALFSSRTIADWVSLSNLRLATKEDMEIYTKHHTRFTNFLTEPNLQVWVRNSAVTVDRSAWWFSNADTDLTLRGKPSKAVLDLSRAGEFADDSSGEDAHGAKSRLVPKIRKSRWLRTESEEGVEDLEVPTHPLLPVFSLSLHSYYWVNVANMSPYKYDESIQGKLILPPNQIKLLDALIKDLELFLDTDAESSSRSRVMTDKAQSRVILLKGPPGVGKTLTSEVYAERIQRPLYEVACGQLGSDPEELEKALSEILNRSIVMDMPLVLNEADVFIKSRGDDLTQNAIISVFLRALEYHTGLVFLTTNRPNDIDDALLSRCIAVINCQAPGEVERKRLWQVLSKEFDTPMPENVAARAAKLFPTAVGRDIQNLLILTRRVCSAHGAKISLTSLKENAMFRNVYVDPAVDEETTS